MTVSTTTNKVAYIGNGIATTFSIPFPFLEQEHLKVKQLLNNEQTDRTDWTVSGGNMVFATAPTNNAQIVIMREVPLTQETDYRENEVLPAETLERNFDKLTMQVQQLKEQAERAVTVDIFDNTDAANLLPSIRQAVSDCAGYAATARDKADTATQKADNASASATSAAQQAGIAADKATEISNALSTKANSDLSNCTKPYLTESYQNGSEWYRVWSDGFIEQGGCVYASGSGVTDKTITFLKPFSTNTYVFNRTSWNGLNAMATTLYWIGYRNKTSTAVNFYMDNDNALETTWTAMGK